MRVRNLLKLIAVLFFCATFAGAESVELHWLDGAQKTEAQGVSFGVPWAQGNVAKGTQFALSAKGKPIPAQTWDLAYWPDGSLKWTGVALVGDAEVDGVTISAGKGTEATNALKVTESETSIEIANSATVYRIPKSGDAILESITIDGARSRRVESWFAASGMKRLGRS